MSEPIKRRNGEWLIPLPGATNTHTDHYHVAADGTILSIVENGDHKYNRQELRKQISEVTGMNFPPYSYVSE